MDSSQSLSDYEPDMDFVSLGMLVLDEIRIPSQPARTNVMGGSGCYATMGARLFSGISKSRRLGCVVLAGRDFPIAAEEWLDSLNMNLVLRKDPEQLSTRGLLVYQDDTFGPKTFIYTTPPLRPAPLDLIDANLIQAKAFHFLASPEDISIQTQQILGLRKDKAITGQPLFAWEPLPATCTLENRQLFLDACGCVDVFSPNHIEMAALFKTEPGTKIDKSLTESHAQSFLDATPGQDGTGCIVVRAGEYGCLVASRRAPLFWMPPYYQRGSPEVVDATGAGNAFLGGFTYGLQQTKDLMQAAQWGTVAASFALEQIGLPERHVTEKGELWNGIDVRDRLQAFRRRWT